MRSEDDLTYKLGDIIKASANVRRCEEEGAPAHVITEFEQLLQVCIPSWIEGMTCIQLSTVPRCDYMKDAVAGAVERIDLRY